MGNCKGICFSNDGVIKRPGESSDLDNITKKNVNNGISKVRNGNGNGEEDEDYDMDYYKQNEDKISNIQQKIRSKNKAKLSGGNQGYTADQKRALDGIRDQYREVDLVISTVGKRSPTTLPEINLNNGAVYNGEWMDG